MHYVVYYVLYLSSQDKQRESTTTGILLVTIYWITQNISLTQEEADETTLMCSLPETVDLFALFPLLLFGVDAMFVVDEVIAK